MTKFRFKDGYECYASDKEEAKQKHKDFKEGKEVVASFEEKEENFENSINKVFNAIDYIKEQVEKSVEALDIVNREAFSKEVVRKYILEIQKFIEESDIVNFTEMAKSSFYAVTKTYSMQEWKEQCIAMLPDNVSVGEEKRVEETLEDLCH